MLLIAISGVGGMPRAASASPVKLWVGRYRATSSQDAASSIAVSPDGATVFVTGESYGTMSDYDYATVAYEVSTGDRMWVARYTADRYGGNDYATSIAVSPDGTRVFVTGESDNGLGNVDYATVAYDTSTGAQQWVARYLKHRGTAVSVAVSPDGAMAYVTGTIRGGTTRNDYATVAYDALTGTQLWAKRYDGPPSGFDDAASMAVSADGTEVFVTGRSDGSTGCYDYATVAYDGTTGVKRWGMRYDGPSHDCDEARSVTPSADGGLVFVTGGSGGDYATIALGASTGQTVWTKRYGGRRSDYATSIAVSPDGTKLAVTGASIGTSSGIGDYATVAYATSDGTRLWATRYDGPVHGDDVASDIASSATGSVVLVTGYSFGSLTFADYLTVAYRSDTGAQRWTRRYDGPASLNDQASAIAVSSDGASVFVTGESAGLGGNDYATVAYQT